MISNKISWTVTVLCTMEMPLPIELVKAQLKVWEYKWVQTVGNPEPHWPYANKTTETYTYEGVASCFGVPIE